MLIILATISINAVLGENGIIRKAEKAREHQVNAEASEQDLIGSIDNEIANILVENPSAGDDELESELKPMVLKFGPINEGEELWIGIYQPYIDIFYNGESIEFPDNTDVTVDWGDGSVEHYTSENLWNDDIYILPVHYYDEAKDEVTVTITGTCNTIKTGNSNSALLLKEIVEWGNTESYYYDFSDSNLVSIPSPEKNTFKSVISFKNTFFGCGSLTSIPDDLFANCTSVKSFEGTFGNCSSLTSIPYNLFKDCTSVENFAGTFGYCEALTGEAIPLWERVQNPDEFGRGIPDGESCYVGCKSLTNFQSIPEYWRSSSQ